MAKVIIYCIRNEKHSGDNVFDVDSPSVFSNPFTMVNSSKVNKNYIVSSKEEGVKNYKTYFDYMLKHSERFRSEFDKLYEAYKKFDVIYLGSYENDEEISYVNIISNKLKNRSIKEMLVSFKDNKYD